MGLDSLRKITRPNGYIGEDNITRSKSEMSPESSKVPSLATPLASSRALSFRAKSRACLFLSISNACDKGGSPR